MTDRAKQEYARVITNRYRGARPPREGEELRRVLSWEDERGCGPARHCGAISFYQSM
jgi:hypothetical protein